jgi:hypothetical protein
MISNADDGDLVPALTDLQDAFARVRAQLHVLRLAMAGLRDERDVRALLCQLGNIEEELTQSEGLIKHHGSAAH